MLYPQRRQEFEAKFYGAAKKFPEFSKDEIGKLDLLLRWFSFLL
jgi:hypothetical protein